MGQTLSDCLGRRSHPTPALSSEHVPGATTTLATEKSAPSPSGSLTPFPSSPVPSSCAPTPVQISAVPTSLNSSTPAQSSTNPPILPKEITVSNMITKNNVTTPTSLYSSANMKNFMKKLDVMNEGFRETFVDTTYSEKVKMKNFIHENWEDVELTEVKVVRNIYLFGMYELKKAEYKSRYSSREVNELTLIHATDATNATSIVKENLDWRRTRRGKYGVGVSFSWNADYCNFYSNRSNGDHRVFVVVSVLIGQQEDVYDSVDVPPPTYDTAIGNRGFVYVKFNDNEFLPKYLVFYNAPNIVYGRRNWW